MSFLLLYSSGIHSRLINGSNSLLSNFVKQQPIFKRYLYRKELYAAYLNMDIEKVGRRGDIVLLKPGFARNFIVGTNKGFIIPKDPRHFKKHQAIYKALGYPYDLILQYYNGEIEALPKGGSLPPSSTSDQDQENSVQASTEILFGKKPPTTMEFIQVRQLVFETIKTLVPELHYQLPLQSTLSLASVYQFIKSKTALPHQWNLTLPFVTQFHFFTLDGKTSLPNITELGTYRVSIHARYVGWLHIPLVVTKKQSSDSFHSSSGTSSFHIPSTASIKLSTPLSSSSPSSSSPSSPPSSSSSSSSSTSNVSTDDPSFTASENDAITDSKVSTQETASV